MPPFSNANGWRNADTAMCIRCDEAPAVDENVRGEPRLAPFLARRQCRKTPLTKASAMAYVPRTVFDYAEYRSRATTLVGTRGTARGPLGQRPKGVV
jgi:hypothetical protein